MMHEKQQGGDSMLRGAIFDLDGALLDSTPVWTTPASACFRTTGQTSRADADGAFSLKQAARFFKKQRRALTFF